MDAIILAKILHAWFDNGLYLTGRPDQYGDTRYVGFHDGRTSEVVTSTKIENELKVYQIDNGGSYLNAFIPEFGDGSGHSENLELIGMFGSGHDFTFYSERNYSECHTTITMVK